MRAPVAVTVSVVALSVGYAWALAPCPPSCHLGQGQPIYLADSNVLLVTRCERTGGQSRDQAQVHHEAVERSDGEFTRNYLEGHTLIELGWQEPWSRLDRPYTLNSLFTRQQLTLSLTGSTLSCAAPGIPKVKREFGCAPFEIHVFATMSHDKPPRRPVVIAGLCRTDSQTTREALVTCAASERDK